MNLSVHSTQIELKKRLTQFVFNPKRAVFFAICALVFTVFSFQKLHLNSAYAVAGINQRVNFQGKVVNTSGTNVNDGNYDIVFKLYTQDSGGVAIWTETWNSGTSQVSVNDGIFRVDLGRHSSLSAVDFNADEYWLSVNFNGDGEMTPRIRLASVPYAFNAQKVAGLTVTDTTGTFTLANLKVFTVNNTLGLSGTDSTTFTFPATSGNVVTEDFAQSLTNKTIGSTGLIFSGATTDVTTIANEDFSIVPNGTGKVNINTTSGLASFDVRSNSAGGGTIAVASISGATSFSALLVDNSGLGDIFTASTGGVPKFTIQNNGSIKSSNYTNNGGILYTSSTGLIQQTAGGSDTNCLTFTGGSPAWGSCGGGGGSSNWVLSSANGTLSPINNTLDLLFGGTGTQSASFSVLGIAASTNPSASVSAQQGADATKGIYLSGDGSLQSVRNNSLTIGGSTTGNINLNPLDSTGTVFINSSTNNANGALKISQGSSTGTSIAIAGATQGSGINITNSLATSGRGLYLSGAVGSGAIGVDIGTGSNQTEGTGVKVNGVRETGVGLNIDMTSNITGGSGILINGSADAGGAFTGSMIGVSPTRALSAANIVTDTGKFLNLARSYTISNASAVMNITGDLANFSSNCTVSSGTCVDTSNILRLNQSYGLATGAVLNIVNQGVGSAAAILSNSGGQSALIIDKTGNAGDIFTASSSGAVKFVVDLNGSLKLAATQTIDTLTTGTLGIATVNATTLTLGRSGQGITLPGFDCSSGYDNSGKLTTTAGGVLTCASDVSGGGSGGSSNWVLSTANGALSPINNTLDFLWGGTGSSSASFKLTGNVASGTSPVASISANSTFAGLLIDQIGAGDFLTASDSGVTKFTITKAGGINASAGITVDVIGSNDIIKSTSGNNQKDTDYQRTANSTSAVLTNLDNTGGEMTLAAGTVSGDGTLTTSNQPAAPAALGAGANSITRQDGKYLVIRGGVTTTMYVYDSLADSFVTAPIVANANVGAGSIALPRQNGKYLLVHGNGVATTSLIDPMGNTPTVAGPTATGTNGAGTNAFRRQNGQYLLIHGAAAGTTRVYNPVANTFAAGPTAASTTWGAGSLILPRQNGTALIVAGGSSANTQLYNSFDGAASIGSFTAGPSLPTNCEINGAGSTALQLSNGRYIILSKAGVSVEYDPENNTMGVCQNVGPPAALADGAHGIRLQDRRYLIFRGSGTTDAYIYDPETNAYSTHATATSTQGAGLHSVQRADGTWQTFVGGSTTTNNYDSQLVMNGSYVSEDIQSSSLNPDSSIWFTGGAEARFSGTSSATLTGDLPQTGMEINVQSASTQGGLDSAISYPIRRNGDKIMAGNDHSWVRVTVNFTRPIPQQLYDERFTWMGNGKTVAQRDYQDPTLYDYMIDNSTVLVKNQFDWINSQGVGDPTEASSSALTRVQAMPDRITLPWGKVPGPTQVSTNIGFYLGIMGTHPPMLQPTGEGTLVIQRPGGLVTIIASGSANMSLYDPASSQFTAQSGGGNIPTANVGDGAFALKLFNGKFLIVMGQNTATTNIYDPNAGSGSQFVQGPNLSGNAGAGAQAIPNKDGTYTIIHGNALTTTSMFNPYTDLTKPGGTTLPTGPTATSAVNCGAWAIPLAGQMQDTYRVFIGRAQFTTGVATTMMYDSTAKQFTAGPNLTTVHGCGSYAFQRQDGFWVTVGAAAGTNGAQTTTLNILNPWSNTTLLGPALTAAAGRGSFVIPRADGTFLISRGQTQTINGNGTNIYFPWGGTFGVGAGIGTSTAGPVLIDYAGTPGTSVAGAGAVTFQRPDGKWVILAGGHAGSNIVNLFDAGWYPDGQYLSNIMYASTLSSDSTLAWRKTNDNFVDFEVRTASTREALSTTPFRSVSRSGDTVGAGAGEKWIQIQANFSRRFMWYDGVNTDVAMGRGALGAQVVSQPTVLEYKVNNAFDFLTLKNGGLNAFRVDKYGGVWTGQQGGFYTGGADLAENYSSKQTLVKGEVVSIDGASGDHNIKKSTGQYESNVLGVVSTNPGFIAGSDTEDAYPVALVGRVPVKISTENGLIREGDALTSASIPGYAMKATVGGRVLGRALHSFDESNVEPCPALGAGNDPATKCGVIMLFVNLVDYNGQSVDVVMAEQGFELDESELPTIQGLDFSQGSDDRRQQEVLAFLKTQKNNHQGIFADNIAATQEIISPKIITDLLVAKKIKAESIEGLEILTNKIDLLTNSASSSAVENLSAKLNKNSININDLNESMKALSARLEKMEALDLLSMTPFASGSAAFSSADNLVVFGTTTLSEASVLNTLTVGNNLTISNSAINALQDLEIQPSRQGNVSFLGGAIAFTTSGEAVFKENVSFEKNVAVKGVFTAQSVQSSQLLIAQGKVSVLSDTEVEATAAAGLITLKKNTDHIKVLNRYVTDTSLIFIAPKTRTSQQLFLLNQEKENEELKIEGSFMVGVDEKADKDIEFNYLIVN